MPSIFRTNHRNMINVNLYRNLIIFLMVLALYTLFGYQSLNDYLRSVATGRICILYPLVLMKIAVTCTNSVHTAWLLSKRALCTTRFLVCAKKNISAPYWNRWKDGFLRLATIWSVVVMWSKVTTEYAKVLGSNLEAALISYGMAFISIISRRMVTNWDFIDKNVSRMIVSNYRYLLLLNLISDMDTNTDIREGSF